MARKGTQYSQEFKFKAALEAARGQATIQEIASRFQVHPNQVRSWRSKLIEERSGIFDRNSERATNYQAVLEAQLFEQSGRLKVGRGWPSNCVLVPGHVQRWTLICSKPEKLEGSYAP